MTFIHPIIPHILFAKNIERDNFILKQKKFISELYIGKKYFNCISETRRLLYYYPDIAGYNEYTYFIEGSYFLGKQYKTVINHLKGSTKYNNLRLPFLILLSQSYLGIGWHNEGIKTLKQIDYSDIKSAQRFNLFIRRTEIYLNNSEYENALSEIKDSKIYIMKKNKGGLFHLYFKVRFFATKFIFKHASKDIQG